MIFGMTTFTIVHVVLSLIGIFSGFVVVFGLLTAKRLDGWTALFLMSTVATSVTGFLFPFDRFLPSHAVGILSLLGTTVAVGQYGAGYRLMESTLFIPLALTTAFAAMFTYLHHESSPTIQSAYGYALKATMGLLVPCAITLFLLPGPVLGLLFGHGFHGAITPLRLLAPVVVLLGVVIISNSLVISRRDPRVVAWAFAGALAVNLVANLALIPALGASGAATAMLLAEGIFAVAMYELAARTVGRPELTRIFAGPALGGVAMALAMLLLIDIPLVAAVVGVVAYVVALVVAERVINPRDLRLAQQVVWRRLPQRIHGAGT